MASSTQKLRITRVRTTGAISVSLIQSGGRSTATGPELPIGLYPKIGVSIEMFQDLSIWPTVWTFA